MPCFKLFTNIARNNIPSNFITKIVPVLARTLQKPENKFVIVVSADCSVSFDNTLHRPAAVASLESIGALGVKENQLITAEVTKLVEKELGISPKKFVTQPMDVIKVRAQLMKYPKKRNVVFRIAKKILREEGLLAFYQGHSLGQIHSVIAVGTQFYMYELATKWTANTSLTMHHKTLSSFLCGVTAGCASTTLVIPLEVIRIRQIIIHDQYRGLIRGAKNVYKTGGILAFYEGLSASLLQMGPSVGISFTTFRLIQALILSHCEKNETCTAAQRAAGHCSSGNIHKPQNLMMASTIAGSLAGFMSKTITYPFDLVKRRLQIGSHKSDSKYKIPSQVAKLAACQSLSKCFINAYKKEGIRGLYRGWTVTVYKAQITSVVAFTTYEMMCFMIREIT